MTAQNIYDDPDFFAGYAKLPRSERGLGIVYEWAAFQRLLPASLADKRVLDLGCGLGYFAREARARGARQVVGVDLSERMLDEARRRTTDAGIVYVRASLEAFSAEPAAFDLVVSSLALHYIADYAGLVRRDRHLAGAGRTVRLLGRASDLHRAWHQRLAQGAGRRRAALAGGPLS